MWGDNSCLTDFARVTALETWNFYSFYLLLSSQLLLHCAWIWMKLAGVLHHRSWCASENIIHVQEIFQELWPSALNMLNRNTCIITFLLWNKPITRADVLPVRLAKSFKFHWNFETWIQYRQNSLPYKCFTRWVFLSSQSWTLDCRAWCRPVCLVP